jgi:putative PIN family toxin of toxin-antitoxin system
MLKVFLDTSVLFSAVYSERGAARDLIRLAIQGQVSICISQLVLQETERNIQKKVPEKLETYRTLMSLLEVTVVDDPTREQVIAAASYTALKDAPIVAAAINTQPDYLVTYDHKDLLDVPQVAEQSRLRIVTPDVVIVALTSQDTGNNMN